MAKSMKSQIAEAVQYARQTVQRAQGQQDYDLCRPIEQAVVSKLAEGFKALVMTDAGCGWNVVVWSPKGRIISSDHRSGYWTIMRLADAA